jgi:RNA polymerase sigma factor (sigma-70 family)
MDRQKHLGRGDVARASTVAPPRDPGGGINAREVATEAMADLRARNGRIGSWFGRWRKPLRGWLTSRASVPSSEVDDLAQEVFLRLLRYSDEIAVENPQGYLFRIAANVASEWREHSRVRQPHDRGWLDELQIDPSGQPDNAAFQNRFSKHLQNVVAGLPVRQRQVLLLHVNEGLTYKQIADHLGVTYRIVLRDLTRAYASLRLQLKAEDL